MFDCWRTIFNNNHTRIIGHIKEHENGNIECQLRDGFVASFSIKGLSDREYVERTQCLQIIKDIK